MNIFNPKFREAREACGCPRKYRQLQDLDDEEDDEGIDRIPWLPDVQTNVDTLLSWDKPKDS